VRIVLVIFSFTVITRWFEITYPVLSFTSGFPFTLFSDRNINDKLRFSSYSTTEMRIIHMNMKRVIIIGTMIVTMSFAGTAWGQSAISPIPTAKWSIVDLDTREGNSDELLSALNQPSEADLYQELYSGKSLRTITEENNGNLNEVIAIQVRQLKEQLDERLARGSISSEQHAAQQAELEELVTQSANTAYNLA